MSRKRILSAAPVAFVAVLASAAVALGAAGDNDTSYGSKGVSQIPTGNGGRSAGDASVMQGDKLVIAGQAAADTGAGPRAEIAVTRLNPDGSRDATFGTNGETLIAAGTGESEAFAITTAPDGKLVVAGSAVDGAVTKIAVARLNANGQPDVGFGAAGVTLMARGNSGVAIGRGVVTTADNRVIVASTVVDGGVNKISMDRVGANGTADGGWHSVTSVGTGTDTRASALTTLADGTFAVAGQADTAAGTQLLLARFAAANGALTGGWGNKGNGVTLLPVGDGADATGNAIVANGSRIVVGGSAADGSVQKTFVGAFGPGNGAPDGTFGTGGITLAQIGTGGSSEANGVAFDAGGNIVVGGSATQDDSGLNQSQLLAARLLPSGQLDPSFAAGGPLPGTSLVSGFGLPAFGEAVSLGSDGKILVAGRVGDGDGEIIAAARWCSTGAQGCTGTGAGTNNPPAAAPGATPNPADIPRQPYECGKTVAFGLIEAEGCIKEVDGRFEASGRVLVNGIIMRPEAGATIILDPKALRLYVQGPGKAAGKLSASVGTITLFENLPFDITLPSVSTPTLKIPNLDVSSRGSLFGFPLTGKADVQLNKGGIELNVLVGLPKIFGGVTGAVTLRADTRSGLHLDGIRITARNALLGPLQVRDVAISYTDSTKQWSGQATVQLQPFPYAAGAGVDIQNGALKSLSFTADRIGVPIGEVVFLQRVSFGVSTDPLTLMGGIGISVGPEVAGTAAVRIDGNFKLSFPGKPLAKLEISSAAFCGVAACAIGAEATPGEGLSVVGLPLAGYKFSFDTDGQITFGGSIGLDLTLVSLRANVSGWIDGVKAFNLEGDGEGCVFVIACAGLKAVVSTEGMAACGVVHFLKAEVSFGFGVHWPLDVDVMPTACDIGPYRATHAAAARAAAARAHPTATAARQTNPTTVTFPAGKDYALVRVTGDTAPPTVTFSGENGAATIDTPAAPSPGVKTDRFMIMKDPTHNQTIIVVTQPGKGPWTITPDAGSSAITNVEQADPLPPVKVKAKVSGSGFKRTLTYDVGSAKGQSVKFAEVGGGVTRQIGVTAKARGSFRFTPGDGNKGSRQIVATVLQDGLPRKQVTVAKYNAPGRLLPTKIKSVSAKRTPSALNVSWTKASNVETYRVMVKVSDGRVLMFDVPSKQRKLSVPDLIPADSAKVTVQGVTKQLRTGPTTPASLKAVKAKKSKKTTSKKTK